MRRLHVVALIALTAAGVLASVGSAGAAPGDPWQYKYSLESEPGTTFGQVAVNHQTGNVLVVGSDNSIHQFDADGDPVAFPATASPEVATDAGTDLLIDNSGGPGQGNFYTWNDTFLRSFHPDGSPIGSGVYMPFDEGIFSFYNPGFDETAPPLVTQDGTLWVSAIHFVGCACDTELVAVTPEMVPIGPRVYLAGFTFRSKFPFSRAGAPVADQLGNVYATEREFAAVPVLRFDASDEFASLGSVSLTPAENSAGRARNKQLAIDPSTDDVYLASTEDEAIGVHGYVTAAHSDSTEASAPIEALESGSGGLSRADGIGFDAAGQTLYVSEGEKVRVFHREPASAPRELGAPQVREVRSRGAVLQSGLVDGGASVTYRFEYGPTATYGAVSEPFVAPRSYFSRLVGGGVFGLEPDTTYHFRIVATNPAGTTYGPDGSFKTYPASPGVDPCPNALARKQTTASRLPDCRAYELVSAADTGGYDVESYLAPGQVPFPGFPLAKDRLLYAIHSGAVPGPWNATNHGPDPYVAARTANGWTTDYKGLPSNLNPAAGSFSSVLGEADSQLGTLAFAGPNLCAPCFTDGGLETGVPVRLPSGQLVQGMGGSLAAGVPASAKPEGKVAKYFSGDGTHLVFASKYAFEPGANVNAEPTEEEPNPPVSLTVYDRNLTAGTTQIVSTTPSGALLTGAVSELDLSADGSRIVVATKTGEDAQGNELVHPYLHIGNSQSSVDLAPGATTGVSYAGMTEDASKVFFTTRDALVAGDTDAGADLYEAAVDPAGNLSLDVVTAPDSDGCNPVANSAGEHWNTGDSTADCGAVAISGGGGVAAASGAVYFLSPEQLDGTKGSADQPNLYLAEPGGSPAFVATLEPDNPLVLDSVKAAAVRRTADFQTTPGGGYAAFTSSLPLSGVATHGFSSAYRYAAAGAQLDCGSCDRTGTSEAAVFAATELPPNGLALLGDGRLFFTTKAQLAVNDANAKKDVYEWSGGESQLVSAGSGPFDSALLSASADGTDVFFFTHDNLAAGEDKNGAQMRIYDAREGGGFFRLPPSVPCQASDECHGPGTLAGAAPDVRSSGKTTPGNVLVCPKNRVKRRGACVKKPLQRKKRHAKKRKGGAKKRNAGATGKRGGRDA